MGVGTGGPETDVRGTYGGQDDGRVGPEERPAPSLFHDPVEGLVGGVVLTSLSQDGGPTSRPFLPLPPVTPLTPTVLVEGRFHRGLGV